MATNPVTGEDLWFLIGIQAAANIMISIIIGIISSIIGMNSIISSIISIITIIVRIRTISIVRSVGGAPRQAIAQGRRQAGPTNILGR